MSNLSLSRASKRARTQQPLLNPLAMMMNPMAGMMNPLAMMNPMMSHMGGMPDGNHAQPLQDDDDADEGPLNAVAVPPIVSQIAAAPAPDVPHQRLADALITRSATYLKNIGRNRLSDCLERLHENDFMRLLMQRTQPNAPATA
eukprot:s180_g7.t1